MFMKILEGVGVWIWNIHLDFGIDPNVMSREYLAICVPKKQFAVQLAYYVLSMLL